jgi:hypothetical protein
MHQRKNGHTCIVRPYSKLAQHLAMLLRAMQADSALIESEDKIRNKAENPEKSQVVINP